MICGPGPRPFLVNRIIGRTEIAMTVHHSAQPAAQNAMAGPGAAASAPSCSPAPPNRAASPSSSRVGRRVGVWIDESAPLPGKTVFAEDADHQVEEHFRGAGYNDPTQDHRNRRR
jgi:hypothetical protein